MNRREVKKKIRSAVEVDVQQGGVAGHRGENCRCAGPCICMRTDTTMRDNTFMEQSQMLSKV